MNAVHVMHGSVADGTDIGARPEPTQAPPTQAPLAEPGRGRPRPAPRTVI
ncbi:hypothetical protein GCM10010360_21250 [Streptomyces nogalater]